MSTKKDDQNHEPRSPANAATFAETLRTARTRRNDSVEALAKALDTQPCVVQAWECGQTTPLRRYYDALVTLYPELAAVGRPVRVRNMRPPYQGNGTAPEPTRSASLVDLLRLIRQARKVRGVIVPLLDAAADARFGILELRELFQ